MVIDSVEPRIASADGRLFPVKRVTGEPLVVEADVFADGHDRLRCVLQVRAEGSPWTETEMEPLGNDRWRARLLCGPVGRYAYRIVGWVDEFATWVDRVGAYAKAHEDVSADLGIGARLVRDAAVRASPSDRSTLLAYSDRSSDPAAGAAAAAEPELARLMRLYDDRAEATTLEDEIPLVVDPQRARCSAWYELFPRSASTEDRHGTFADVRDRLPLIEKLGFDVVYLPPIHPIGTTARRGPDNAPDAGPGAIGSPWAIGSERGGHDAIDPELGTLADFHALIADARRRGMDIALDLAFQCSPDHPYVREHPEWFRHRPDGSIRTAENPPKRYRDIYPLDFESEDRRALWAELLRVTLLWVERGIRIFRVDNPHTKPFAFWEWLISEVKRDHPDVIFLAEAFTRPKIMYRLAKLGFTQSYTYFTWRNTKAELTDHLTELTSPPVVDFFRPNLWPNTPDILHETLQTGGRAAFMARLVLAATLGASYGIYGPAFELGEDRPAAPGSEEYLHSEKYQRRIWDWGEHAGIRGLIERINRIRRENPALWSDRRLRFHRIENDLLIAYSKRTESRDNVIVTVVSLDHEHMRSGFLELDLGELGVDAARPFEAHDLLGDGRYRWQGARAYVELRPEMPAHVFRIEGRGEG